MALTRPTLNQINTTITALNDPLTVINKSATTANVDVGFVFNRDGGSTANVAVIWDETNDQFALVTTSSSGATNANVTISDYANVRVGSAFVDDVLRIAQNASGLRMTNVGAFDNDGSDNFRIFATNDLILAANGDSGTAITIDATNSNVAVSNDLTVAGTVITGNILPSANLTYNLGSITNQWHSLYVGPGSLYVNGQKVLQEDSGTIVFSADENQNISIQTAGSGDIEFNPGGTIELKGNVVLAAGKTMSQAGGSASEFSAGVKSDSVVSRTADTNLTLSANGTGVVNVNDSLTVANDVTVTGNLTVNGATTTVSSTNTVIEDALLLLADGQSGAPTKDAGFVVERGSSTNVAWLWDESADQFVAVTTSDDATTAGDVTITDYTDIRVGSATIDDTLTLGGTAITATASELNKLDGYTGGVTELNYLDTLHATGVTDTEFDYLDGVTSAIQTQLNAKQATITGAATTIDTENLTASRALVSDGSGKVAVSAVTSTEIGYLDGVTSAIQTQLDAKLASANLNSSIDSHLNQTNPTAGYVLSWNGSDYAWVVQSGGGGGGTTIESDNSSVKVTDNGVNPAYIEATVDGTIIANITASGVNVTGLSISGTAVTATAAELNYVDGVTSAIQTQLNAKAPLAGPNFTGNVSIGSILELGDGQTSGTVGHTATLNEGIFWHTSNTDYAIYRTSGAWSAPDYSQLKLKWPTGIVLDPGSAYGKSFVDVQGRLKTTSFTLNGVDITATGTELNYVDGVTSAIQTQLNAKASLSSATFTGLIIGKTGSGGSVAASNDAGSLSVRGNGTNAAVISFHRPGLYAINMGLDTDNVFKIGGWSDGASTYRMQVSPAGIITGTATQARYADLAEKYVSDKDYAPGTVVVFGGGYEITESTKSHQRSVAGVISTRPAYLMNSDEDGLPVALQGRVPCKVKGPIDQGDLVVASDIPGVAQRLYDNEYKPGCVIGKALNSIEDDEIHSIEVVVGRL